MDHPAEAKAGALLARVWGDFLKRRSRDVLALVPVLLTVALAGNAYALILKDTIDRLQGGDHAVIFIAPALILATTCIRALAIWGQAVMTQALGQTVLCDMQGAMFARLMRADYALYQAESTGALVSRFVNDTNIVAEGLVRGAQALLRDTVTLIAAVGLLFYFDWVLALCVLALFGFAAKPLSDIARRGRRQTNAQQLQMGELVSLLNEVLAAPRFVKTYLLERREQARAERAFEQRRRILMKLVYNRARADPLLEVLGGAAMAAIILVAGARIQSGAMTIGDFLGIVSAIGVATPAARSLGSFNTLLNEGFAALSRIFTFLDTPDKVVDRPGASTLLVRSGRIVFDRVRFDIGGETILQDMSFVVEPGQTVALVGPSGAGKSTVLNLLLRLYDATEGVVAIDGQDVLGVTQGSLRSHIAFVAQDSVVFDDTIAANIAFGAPAASQADIETAAKAAGAHQFISARPGAYSARTGERGGNLSGGERQRIALARAFLRDAPILLLDEATSALDAESEAHVQDAIARLQKGRTTLVIAHRLATVRDADRILVMDKGRIVEAGRHDELLSKDGLYARLAKLQFQD